MTSIDILYYTLAIGFVVLVGFVSFAAFSIAVTLRSFRALIHKVEGFVLGIDKIKGGILGLLISALGLIFRRRGGEKNGRK